MYTQEPVRWFDVGRVREDHARIWFNGGSNFIPVSEGHLEALGIVKPRYPTPDELFRWQPSKNNSQNKP